MGIRGGKEGEGGKKKRKSLIILNIKRLENPNMVGSETREEQRTGRA